MKIIGIAASLHGGSYINRLLDAIRGELPPGAAFETWSRLGEIPPYAPGPAPQVVRELLALVDGADALVLTAPEHSLLPTELEYALDWMGRAGTLDGKHVAVMCASARACGAMWAQAELYKELLGAGAVAVGSELVISPVCPHFDDNGRLWARDLRGQVREMVAQLCQAHLREPMLSA
ncbi:NAD(P)H-dependent oxidoreductase [Nonomuraea sp. MCN248]|uniref:NAD(P)H-dependent oxidoreductase n=1 Tax=Nonomuraea corallina TaxID=2989783 RepID=A0ABT4S5X1_9ACTN|nr:NAD(P)H-dependent oxidoreductase [Nonomuraea corallina]MDA0632593.1 NAD(P)H-dependent oxidoreductase [Nonomuraea corallina]